MDMRRRGSGSYDHTTGAWRLKHRRIQATTKQLGDLFGVELPKSEQASKPYWEQFLKQEIDKQNQQARAKSPLSLRVWSIDRLIFMLQGQGRDTTALETELQRCLDVGEDDIDQADVMMIHPDVEPVATELGYDHDDVAELTVLEKYIQCTGVAKKESIRHEGEQFLERYKAKGHDGWHNVRAALETLLACCGDVGFRDLNATHWRAFFDTVKAHTTWSQQTKVNKVKLATQFLHRLEADYNLTYGFLRNPDYKLQRPDGKKEQYTLEQVQLALTVATGVEKTMLLLGLNAGMYQSDVAALKQEHFDGANINMGRVKNEYQHSPMIGSWSLWPETVAVLQYGLSRNKIGKAYGQFAKKHGLPPHKALRKTVAQWIEDEVGETESRLYRCEKCWRDSRQALHQVF